MTSHPAGSDDDARGPAICKRPGCGRPLPAQGRGRNRVFCGGDCAQRFHNDARIPAPAAGAVTGDQDPLTALDALTRQAAVLVRAAREQAASLDPARVRAQVADAEAARRRAEAAVVTARAQAAEAREETDALAEALAAAREDAAAAQDAARHQADAARAAAAALEQLRADTAAQVTAIQARAADQAAAARTGAETSARERDDALAAARDARQAAGTEVSRARQAEADARAEAGRGRDDASRERENLREHHQAQLAAAHELTAAERADRRTLTSHLTSPASDNGSQQPAGIPDRRGGARSK